MDSKLIESWLRLTADALKGAEEARKALESLAQAPPSPDALSRWAAAWLPADVTAGGATDAPQELARLVERWWQTLGVVPRYQYLELLAKYEELKGRLEQAESTVRNLRELLARRGDSPEVREVLDGWEEGTRRALDAQAEWARTWLEGVFGNPPSGTSEAGKGNSEPEDQKT